MRKLAVLLLLLTLPAWAATVLGLDFEAPQPLTAPTRVGLDAESVSWPAEGKPKLEVLLHTVPGHVAAEMRQANVDPFANEKTVYLGLATPPQSHRTRTILGAEVKGDVHPDAFPEGSHLEAYWLKLPDGRELLLAFTRAPGVNAEEVEPVIAAICKTLRPR